MTQSSSLPALRFVPTSIPIYAVIGASVGFTVSAVNPDGTPFDLTGWTITAPFVRRPPPTGDPGPLPITAWAVGWDAVAPSRITLTLEESDTGAVAPVPGSSTATTLEWAIWLEAADASQTFELLRGTLILVAA